MEVCLENNSRLLVMGEVSNYFLNFISLFHVHVPYARQLTASMDDLKCITFAILASHMTSNFEMLRLYLHV